MSTIKSLRFDISSSWDGAGLARAREELDSLKRDLDEINGKNVRPDISIDTARAREELDQIKRDLDEIANKSVSARVTVDDGGARTTIDNLRRSLDDVARTRTATVRANADNIDSIRAKLDDLARLREARIRANLNGDTEIRTRLDALIRQRTAEIRAQLNDMGVGGRLDMLARTRTATIRVNADQSSLNRLKQALDDVGKKFDWAKGRAANFGVGIGLLGPLVARLVSALTGFSGIVTSAFGTAALAAAPFAASLIGTVKSAQNLNQTVQPLQQHLADLKAKFAGLTPPSKDYAATQQKIKEIHAQGQVSASHFAQAMAGLKMQLAQTNPKSQEYAQVQQKIKELHAAGAVVGANYATNIAGIKEASVGAAKGSDQLKQSTTDLKQAHANAATSAAQFKTEIAKLKMEQAGLNPKSQEYLNIQNQIKVMHAAAASSAANYKGKVAELQVQLSHMTKGSKDYASTQQQIADTQRKINQAMGEATPVQQHVAMSLQQLKDDWQAFQREAEKTTGPVLASGFEALSAALPKLIPLIRAVGPIFQDIADRAKQFAEGNGMTKFVDWIIKVGVPNLKNIAATIGHLFTALFQIMHAFGAQGNSFTAWLAKVTAELDQWGKNGGFQRFADSVKKEWPQIKQFLLELMTTIGHVSKAMQGLGPLSLSAFTLMLQAINKLPIGAIQAIVVGFMAIKTALIAIKAVEGVIAVFEGIAKAITLIRDAMAAARLVALAFDMSLLPMIGIAALIVVALVAVGIGIYELVTHWKGFTHAMGTAWRDTWNVIKTVGEAIGRFFSGPFLTPFKKVGEFFSGPFVRFFTQTIPHIAEAIGRWTTTAAQAVGRFVARIGTDIGHFFSGPFVRFFTDAIPHIASAIGRWTTSAATAVGRFVARIGTDIGHFFSGPFVRFFTDAIPHMAEAIGKWAAGVAGKIASFFSALGKDFVKGIKELGSMLLKGGEEIAKDLWNGLKNGLLHNPITDTVKHVGKGILDGFKHVFKIFSPSQETHQMGIDLNQGLGNGLNTGVVHAVTAAGQVAIRTLAALKESFKQIDQVGMEAMKLLATSFQFGLASVINIVQTFGPRLADTFKNTFEQAKNQVKSELDSIVQQVKQGLENIRNTVQSSTKDLVDKFKQAYTQIKDDVTKAMQDILDKSKQTLTQMRSQVTTDTNAMKATWTTFTNNLKSTWTSTLNNLKSTWTSFSNNLKSTWTSTFNSLKTTANTFFTWAKTTFKSTLDNMKSSFTSFSSSLKSSWTDLWNGIKSSSQTVWDWLKSTWQTTTQAMLTQWTTIAGQLKSNWQATWNWMRDTAKQTWQEIQDQFKVPINFIIKGWDLIADVIHLPHINQLASGGHVRGPGTSTSDSIPAMLSDGEYVVNAKAVGHYGVDTLHKMNAMHLATGGLVDGSVAQTGPGGFLADSGAILTAPSQNVLHAPTEGFAATEAKQTGTISEMLDKLKGIASDTVYDVAKPIFDDIVSKVPDPISGIPKPAGSVPHQSSSEIVKGVESALKKIQDAARAAAASGPGGGGGGGGGGVGGVIPSGQHKSMIDAALAKVGIAKDQWAKWEAGLNTLITRESSWNPNAINLWDSNAKAGHPTQGLMQLLPSNFAKYGMGGSITNGLDNIVAGIRYIKAVYGDISNVQQANAGAKPKGYASGTEHADVGWALVGEEGPELVNFGGGEKVLNADRTKSAFENVGGHGGCGETHVHIDARGATAEAVDKLNSEAIPQLRMAITAGHGRKGR